jgi:hypothetical protein
LALIVVLVTVLNVADAVFTVAWVGAGRATELNPLMRWLVEDHPVAFVVLKTALVLLATVLLWRYRQRPLAVIGLFAAFILYYWITVHHLWSSTRLLGIEV